MHRSTHRTRYGEPSFEKAEMSRKL